MGRGRKSKNQTVDHPINNDTLSNDSKNSSETKPNNNQSTDHKKIEQDKPMKENIKKPNADMLKPITSENKLKSLGNKKLLQQNERAAKEEIERQKSRQSQNENQSENKKKNKKRINKNHKENERYVKNISGQNEDEKEKYDFSSKDILNPGENNTNYYSSRRNSSSSHNQYNIKRSTSENQKSENGHNNARDKKSYDSHSKQSRESVYSSRNSFGSMSKSRYYDNSKEKYDNSDKEFNSFINHMKNHQIADYNNITEIKGNLFDVSEDFALAHCVAEDMCMGAGIAKIFRYEFKNVGKLLNQNQKQGGLAVLLYKNRFIYYLVTKRISQGKPTFHSLWKSLKHLKLHMLENNVKKLAIPKIGCGLDKLNWDEVKAMLAYLFKDTGIIIHVYYIDEFDAVPNHPDMPKNTKKAYIQHSNKSLNDAEIGTARMYFGNEEASETPEIKMLGKKFNFFSDYKKSHRVGDIIRTLDNCHNELIYGLIIRKSEKDEIDYETLEETFLDFDKMLYEDNYGYLGFEISNDCNLGMLNKILYLMQNLLGRYSICVYKPMSESCSSDNV